MSNYFSQFIPQLGKSETKTYVVQDASSQPRLNYIGVFNPTLVNDKSDSTEEYLKQILCFVAPGEADRVEQLKVVGLIRGIDSFARNFGSTQNTPNVIESTKSTIILHQLEENYHLICSVSGVSKVASQQLGKLLENSYHLFVLFHRNFGSIHSQFGLDVLKSTLDEFWGGFLNNYNLNNSSLSWFNRVNYKGFLGLIDKRTYKKSSISLNNSTHQEIDQLINNSSLDTPKGIIVSYFNKTSAKNYGHIYMNNYHDDQLGDDVIPKQALVDISNWLEYYDYHERLDTENLASISSSTIFKSNLRSENETNGAEDGEADVMSLRTATASALEILHPVNLTNSLVVSPLNYTVNSMINIGEHVRGAPDSNNAETSKKDGGWFPILSNFQGSTSNFQGNTSNNPVNVETNENNEEEEEEEEEAEGVYLLGARNEDDSEPLESMVIHRKLIYLATKYIENGSIMVEDREYQLVIYTKNDLYISLIFDSCNSSLDSVEFYQNLAHDVLEPSIEEISGLISGGSMIGNSVTSLKSLNALIHTTYELDSDFFFVVYDEKEHWINSSLPYLPKPNSHDKLSMVMYFLHEQLSSVFLTQEFFTANNTTEYFHKFTSYKNDWMLYYIQHKDKYIIIIKNHNRNSRSKRLRKEEHTEVVGNQLGNQFGNQFGNQLGNQLGFLDSLGVDVKYWLESFSLSGET